MHMIMYLLGMHASNIPKLRVLLIVLYPLNYIIAIEQLSFSLKVNTSVFHWSNIQVYLISK